MDMNEFDVDLRLDEDFLFIFNFSKDILTNLTERPQENELCQHWLAKLCMERVEGLHAKRLRNNYLVRLLSFLREGKLADPFLVPPKDGPLEPLPVIEITDKEPPWLKQLIAESEQETDYEAAKDCRLYLNTKVFDENRGACAYLAISVADEGNVPHWIQTGDTSGFEEHLKEVLKALNLSISGVKDESDVSEYDDAKHRDFVQFIVDAIGMELSGMVDPETLPTLECFLEKFMDGIKDTSLMKEIEKVSKPQQRHCLLVQLQSFLINGLLS
ncbi:uncharacterized protein LOC119647727 [Hermetia illucens]|uniref:uncharacterized protein LOC119647727 n=1 Tax=Hermetia illucens TaxID=343691 RepID=UPI0018CBF849|nr:uncharacterized protein LOC119647727 [Hermetia illucens]